MKLFTFELKGQRRVAAEWEGKLVDLATTYHASLEATGPKPGKLRAIPTEMASFIRLENLALEAASDAIAFVKRRPAVPVGEQLYYPFDGVEIAAPILRPGKILVCEATSRAESEGPRGSLNSSNVLSLSVKLPNTVIGPGGSIIKPRHTQHIRSVGRLAAIIGKPIKRIQESDALGSILGYTIVNDIFADTGPNSAEPALLERNFDTFCPFGPCIVTADEFTAHKNLRIRTVVSGSVAAEKEIEDFKSHLARSLSSLSQVMNLQPGDVVCVRGENHVASNRSQPIIIEPGATVAIESDSIGMLENRVVEEGMQ